MASRGLGPGVPVRLIKAPRNWASPPSVASHPLRLFSASTPVANAASPHPTAALQGLMPGLSKGVPAMPPPLMCRPGAAVPLAVHSFPSLEPLYVEHWSSRHLGLPMRRDLLHHAVIYEGDCARQGSASSKTRHEVHGSHRKMLPQKGTGRARRGTRQSPLMRGGGKSFGPHPRDFASKLNLKVYDKAWRTALSYRYRQGELIVCDDVDLTPPRDFRLAEKSLKDGLREAYLKKYTKHVMDRLSMGRAYGRTLFVTASTRHFLFEAMALVPSEGLALDMDDVDVKDLLETGRIVMERRVLEELIRRHQSDLTRAITFNGLVPSPPPMGQRAGY